MRRALACAALALLGCGARTVVIVGVSGVSTGVDALTVHPSLDGRAAMSDVRVVGDLGTFSLEVPDGTLGTLHLEVEGLAGTRVALRGATDVTLAGPGTFHAALALAAPRLPAPAWHTFLGGTGDEAFTGVAAAPDGGVYVIGNAAAEWGQPLRGYAGGSGDAFVARLDASGSLVWHTFLGGGGYDWGETLMVASGGELYVAGHSFDTWGTPIRRHQPKSLEDQFLARLEPDGTLTWNTFLGGDGQDYANALADGGADGVYLAGRTFGAPWGSPVESFSGGPNDASLCLVNRTGDLVWNTFVGGVVGNTATALMPAPGGGVVVVGDSGVTWGTPRRAMTESAGMNDAYAAHLDNRANVVWNTFLGGMGADLAAAVARDATGFTTVVGSSSGSWAIPVRAFASTGPSALAVRLDATGNLLWNTFLGAGTNKALGVAMIGGDTILAGLSSAPWAESAPGVVTDGIDIFVARLDPGGALLDHAFFGGHGDEANVKLGAGPNGEVFVASTASSSFGVPVRAYAGGTDLLVIKLPAPR